MARTTCLRDSREAWGLRKFLLEEISISRSREMRSRWQGCSARIDALVMGKDAYQYWRGDSRWFVQWIGRRLGRTAADRTVSPRLRVVSRRATPLCSRRSRIVRWIATIRDRAANYGSEAEGAIPRMGPSNKGDRMPGFFFYGIQNTATSNARARCTNKNLTILRK